MEDPLMYTYDGLERELNLLEIHLKEAPKGDIVFCEECIDKHISTSRGYALEGPGFTEDKEEQKRFLDAEKQLQDIKGGDYKKNGVEFAQKVRELRKNLIEKCPNCKTLSKSEIEDLTKDLNTKNAFNILADENHTHNSEAKLNKIENNINMVTYKELGILNAGQFAAEGVRYAVDSYKPEWTKYVGIGGGLGLQILGLFVLKKQKLIQTIALVAGSNLLAKGVVDMIKTGVAPAAVAVKVANQGVGSYGGKAFSYAPAFGGPTFAGKVTATNIPSQYARAGILSGAQAFEAPEHADLIRVD